MFKRPRLRLASPLVNVGLAASLIFISACSGEREPATTETIVEPAPNAVDQTAERPKLQAVWATRALSSPVVDIAISGGPNPVLAAVLAGDQIQLFNLDGERLTDPTTIGAKMIADGRTVTLGDVPLTLFPGIGAEGNLNIYVYNTALGVPAALDLLPEVGAIGLCSGPAATVDALLTLGYWTAEDPETLIIGNLYETDDAFTWDRTDAVAIDTPIGACLLTTRTKPLAEPEDESAGLTRIQKGSETVRIRLLPDGELEEVRGRNASPLSIQAGISVKAPASISAVAALSLVQFGGYPDGVVVVAGDVDGDPKLVFVEPIALFEDAAE